MRYAVVFEQTCNNHSAYVPDLPGFVATGETVDDVKLNIREPISFHLGGMALEKLPIPESSCWSENIDVEA